MKSIIQLFPPPTKLKSGSGIPVVWEDHVYKEGFLEVARSKREYAMYVYSVSLFVSFKFSSNRTIILNALYFTISWGNFFFDVARVNSIV